MREAAVIFSLPIEEVKPTESELKRFWSKVDKSGECWNWTGAIWELHGYGAFAFRRQNRKAHRFSFYIHFGPIPKSVSICHKCDNRRCINPSHLFHGSQKDNYDDMVKKGRGRLPGSCPIENFSRGVDRYNSVASSEQVRQIRSIHEKSKMTFTDIGKIFGIDRQVISRIVKRISYINVP